MLQLIHFFMFSDRKKDLVKLMHGEYISLAKVEGVMCQSKYIDNCCVYGDSAETYVVLLVVPHIQNLQVSKTLFLFRTRSRIIQGFAEMFSEK